MYKKLGVYLSEPVLRVGWRNAAVAVLAVAPSALASILDIDLPIYLGRSTVSGWPRWILIKARLRQRVSEFHWHTSPTRGSRHSFQLSPGPVRQNRHDHRPVAAASNLGRGRPANSRRQRGTPVGERSGRAGAPPGVMPGWDDIVMSNKSSAIIARNRH